MEHFVFAADLHLDTHIWSNTPEVQGDAFDAAAQVFNHTVHSKAKALVLGGDIFNRHPTSEVVRFWLVAMKALKDAGIKVYAIQGQHGRTANGVPWHSIENSCMDIHRQTIPIFNGVNLFALERMPGVMLKEHLDELKDRKDIQVLVLHQLLKGTVPDIQGSDSWDLDPDWVPEHIKLVLLGDLHEPLEIQPRLTKFIYNGSTCLRSISEPSDKSFLVVKEDLSVERIPLSTRVFKTYVIFAESQLKAAVDNIVALPPKSVAYIKYDPRVEDVESKVRKACEKSSSIPLFRTVVTMTEEVGQVDIPEKVTLEGCLDLVMDRAKEPEVFSFAKELLTGVSSMDAIDTFRRRIVG